MSSKPLELMLMQQQRVQSNIVWTRDLSAIKPSSSPYPVRWATLRAPSSWWPE